MTVEMLSFYHARSWTPRATRELFIYSVRRNEWEKYYSATPLRPVV